MVVETPWFCRSLRDFQAFQFDCAVSDPVLLARVRYKGAELACPFWPQFPGLATVPEALTAAAEEASDAGHYLVCTICRQPRS